jgi:NAD(P)-dependent dehydrogenase (short-subunit alcohol dehydrogenase family)
VTEADFDATLAVNLKGTFFASQAAFPYLKANAGGGRIVNVGSQAGAVVLPGEAVYCMTKAAISHLTKCLAVEWGKHNITVNTVAPTFIVGLQRRAGLAQRRLVAGQGHERLDHLRHDQQPEPIDLHAHGLEGHCLQP